nr:MAG TPA: hypothetical protein [Caudoviricetes sp.]
MLLFIGSKSSSEEVAILWGLPLYVYYTPTVNFFNIFYESIKNSSFPSATPKILDTGQKGGGNMNKANIKSALVAIGHFLQLIALFI